MIYYSTRLTICKDSNATYDHRDRCVHVAWLFKQESIHFITGCSRIVAECIGFVIRRRKSSPVRIWPAARIISSCTGMSRHAKLTIYWSVMNISLMAGYEYIIDKNHHCSGTVGQVYVHMIEAEKMLGRDLLEGEVVHHKDRNRTNNAHNNLIVFATLSDHTRFHQLGCNEGLLVQLENGSYSCNRSQNTICPLCQKNKSRKAKMCLQCAIDKRNSSIPDKESLLNKLIELKGNFSAVGRYYGVTDNAVRKWCKRHNLNHHSTDYLH